MINRKIVMIPGPSPTVRSIQDQMGRDTAAFGDPEFVKDYKSVIEDLKDLMDVKKGQAFVIAGTGSLAMEMAIANNTKEGDNVLVISHGFFGDRFLDVTRRKKLNVDIIQSEWGKIVPVEEIEKKLSEKHYAAMTVSHVDTATGVLAPIEEIGKMMHEKYPDTIYIVDGVAANRRRQILCRRHAHRRAPDRFAEGLWRCSGAGSGVCRRKVPGQKKEPGRDDS